MELNLADINWTAVVASIIAGQVISTVWFVVLFGEPWAREYGASSKQQHTKEVPGYTYGVQFLCTVALVLSLAVAHRALGVASVIDALQVGCVVSVGFCIATGLPGQAFLKRWRAAAIALGSQVAMIVGISIILGAWQ
ncbi:MAG: DUF1761 domain-containing protein [Nannocystaceae bacterium]